MIFQRAEFSGPLPPPSILAKYEEVVPGAAERIISTAENETRHRQALEKATVEGYFLARRHGAHWGGVISLATLAAGTFLVATGHNVVGLAALAAAISAPVIAFVTGQFLRTPKPKGEAENGNSDS